MRRQIRGMLFDLNPSFPLIRRGTPARVFQQLRHEAEYIAGQSIAGTAGPPLELTSP